jgi:excisionase family DNA binding protein
MPIPPEQLITIVPADVAYRLLAKAGLAEYRRRHRGEDWRTDQVLIELSNAAVRWRELADNGQRRAPNADTMPPSLSQRLTTKQVASITGVSDRTIRRAIVAGRLPAERVGRIYLVNRQDVGRYRTRGA